MIDDKKHSHEDDDDEFEDELPARCKIFKKSLGTQYDVYLSDSIQHGEAHYLPILRLCEDAKPGDVIFFHLANVGGSCHTGFRLAALMRNTQAETYAIVEAPCYSMGAFLALAPKHLAFHRGTFLMFHNFSSINSGKGHELALAIGEFEKHFKFQTDDICSPFLTTKEIQQLHADRDVYVHAEDKDLLKRLKRHEASRNKGG